MKLLGIHHITAIASDPQRNLDFYTQLLGLRLVKRTVNFDDPSTYHFYFGDRIGAPGTIITFFPWPGARRGARGTGQVVATSFAVAMDAIDYWKSRFQEHHVAYEETEPRFDDTVLRLADPDGLMLELIASNRLNNVQPVLDSEIPSEFSIRGFHAPTLEVQRSELTEQLLIETLGFERMAEEGTRRRFSLDRTSASKQLDLVEGSNGSFGNIAAGTIHHIAFRAANEEEQLRWRNKLVDLGLSVTPVIDRQYFHSIYFREPGGILFEIATDGPGFVIDEPVEHLGESLKLPAQYEGHRAEIEQVLPPIQLVARASLRAVGPARETGIHRQDADATR
jgi:glyoxalase family protein